jgi:hypothetical protein
MLIMRPFSFQITDCVKPIPTLSTASAKQGLRLNLGLSTLILSPNIPRYICIYTVTLCYTVKRRTKAISKTTHLAR